MPGMNGEVAIIAERRENVVSVPNEAIRSMREAAQGAAILGIDPDSVQAQLRSAMGGGMGGFGGGQRPAGAGGPQQGGPRPGYVDLAPQQGGRPQGGQGGQGGFQMPNVTDAQCKAITDARTAKPAAAKKVDDLNTKMRDPNVDRMALVGEMRTAYTELGVDQNIARACRARDMQGGAPGAAPTPGAANPAAATPVRAPAGANGTANASRQGANRPASRSVTRTGLVFVQRADSSWEARVVRLGVADYDFTEVVSGLNEGDRVALLSAAALQAQRLESQDRMRAMTGGNSPLGGSAGGARPAGGGGPR
jgi:HlyD family secretion protein